jgi:hypothetical protein
MKKAGRNGRPFLFWAKDIVGSRQALMKEAIFFVIALLVVGLMFGVSPGT